MTSIKKNPYITILLCTLLAFLTSYPSITKAETTASEQNFNALVPNIPPLSVQAKQNPTYISPYMRYAFNLSVKDAQSVYTQKNKFKPYDSLQLGQKLGTYWFLVSFSPVKDKSISAAYLDIGNFLTKDSRILILPKNSTKWQLLDDVYTREKLAGVSSPDSKIKTIETKSEITIFSNGLYDLTGLRDGGELLIYSPGMPSIWFSPTLILPAKASVTIDRRIAPFVLVSLVLLMFFSLWRGLREEGDARLWAALITLFALIQYIWGIPQNADGNLRIWDMIGIISAACALFLLPHIGRHYMVTEKNSPNLDGFLQFLALPAICPLAIILIPLPEYLPIIRFAPLWGIYAFLPLIFCLPMALSGRKGALFYVFFCFCIGSGALIALAFRFNPTWYIAPQVGLAIAMIAMFLAPRQTEKNVYEKTYTENTDHLSDFAENSIPMREAFFRVEAKLRDPFDQIIREACFLDFDTKSEDFTESISVLADKKLGELYDKHTLNAIDDIAKRAERLRNHTDSLVRACRDLSGMMGLMPQLAKKVTPHQPTHELFNLKNLVLHACDGIRTEAQDKQIGLGWYIAPQMGLFYRGDKAGLGLVLDLLLRDSVRATEKGMISIRVRRANNPNPGHIVFTISDSGKGKPPVQRSSLTLIKAWELSTNYNGQVELHSSSNGLSFSFSMECVAMDAQGIKPLSFASLDDIVLLSNEFDKGRSKLADAYSSENGQSGGNIVFSRERSNDANTTHAGGFNSDIYDNINMTENENAQGLYVRTEKVSKISILLISPLAIQRQNIAWYLNQYEIWEALDVDSALAFYEKKPAMLVLVHSALTTNGCNAVLAGIRLLEDSLGISPAPFVGLYQSAKDMEFLRLAGCKHLLPANIGRENLCIAVAEIMDDPFIDPISDIDAEHTVIKKIKRNEKGQTAQEVVKEQATLAVAKRLNMKRVHAGQVIDGALDNNQDAIKYTIPSSHHSHSAHGLTKAKRENNEAPYPQSNFHTGIKNRQENSDNIYNNTDLIKPPRHGQDKKQVDPNQIKPKQIESKPNTHANDTAEHHIKQLYDSEQHDDNNDISQNNTAPQHSNALAEHTSFMSGILRIIRPKPGKSLQNEMGSHYADLVGEPMPLNAQTKNQSHIDEQAYTNEQMHTELNLNAEANPHADNSSVDDFDTNNFYAENASNSESHSETSEQIAPIIENDTQDDTSENSINSDTSILLDLEENKYTFLNKDAKPHLAFLPSESENYSPANDEDIPTISLLSSAFNGNEESSPFQEMENENIFIQSGLIDAERGKNELELTHLNSVDTAEDEMVLPSEMDHNIPENTDMSPEDYNTHANEALLNLNLEFAPIEESNAQKKTRKKKESAQRNAPHLDKREHNDDSDSPVNDSNNNEVDLEPVHEKNSDNAPKSVADTPMQLSFFPTSDDDSDK